MTKSLLRLILLIIITLNHGLVKSQKTDKCEQAFLLVKMIEKHHYSPASINDKFSQHVYKSFLETLDPYGTYFLSSEIAEISKYSLILDDEINNRSCEFLTIVTGLYRNALTRGDSIISKLLSKPLDFDDKQTIAFSKNDTISYAKGLTELNVRWEKWLKYQALAELIDPEQDTAVFEKTTQDIMANEEDIRQVLLERETRSINRILKKHNGYEEYINALYLDAIAGCYDPHTAYFSLEDKDSFESSLSKEVYSYGIEIGQNKNGEIQISKLTPGGPAWKSNELNKGDILLKIITPKGKIIDVTDSDIYQVADIIQSLPGDRIELKIKKKNGLEKTVMLIKEKMESDENIIKSFVLNGEMKFGYIALPGFYTEFENVNALGCANDVAKEIIKLQREDIKGLILDLRNNTGGSMKEALELAGIFIDEGPLSIIHNGKDRPFSLKDKNRGTIYDDPLVIIVNGSSASASEILAAALQDYNRAIIVGSTTFGKSTGQVVMPVDTAYDPYSADPSEAGTDHGFVKITMDKFYRITGATHQLNGVVPDVPLPDYYSMFDYRESSYPNPIPNDSIIKKMYYTPLPEINSEWIADSSKARITSNPAFSIIKTVSDSIQLEFEKDEEIPLDLTSYIEYERRFEQTLSLLDSLSTCPANIFTVENHQYDADIISFDSYRREINDIQIDNIEEDIYLGEVFRILRDFIKFEDH